MFYFCVLHFLLPLTYFVKLASILCITHFCHKLHIFASLTTHFQTCDLAGAVDSCSMTRKTEYYSWRRSGRGKDRLQWVCFSQQPVNRCSASCNFDKVTTKWEYVSEYLKTFCQSVVIGLVCLCSIFFSNLSSFFS